MDELLTYLMLGVLLVTILLCQYSNRDGRMIGYPKGIFTPFEYFFLVTCWPLLLVVLFSVRMYKLLKDKVL